MLLCDLEDLQASVLLWDRLHPQRGQRENVMGGELQERRGTSVDNGKERGKRKWE